MTRRVVTLPEAECDLLRLQDYFVVEPAALKGVDPRGDGVRDTGGGVSDPPAASRSSQARTAACGADRGSARASATAASRARR